MVPFVMVKTVAPRMKVAAAGAGCCPCAPTLATRNRTAAVRTRSFRFTKVLLSFRVDQREPASSGDTTIGRSRAFGAEQRGTRHHPLGIQGTLLASNVRTKGGKW